MNRNDIQKQYLWDLDAIYDSMDSFMQEKEKIKDMIEKISDYKDVMLNGSKEFYETISLYYDINRRLEKLYCYANLLFDSDTSLNDNQSLKGSVSNLYALLSSKAYFISSSILKLEWEDILKFIREEEKLKEYEKLLKDEFRFKNHTLSDDEERLLSTFSKIIGNNYDTYELFKDCDLFFGSIIDEEGRKVQLNNNNYSLYIESKNRKVREDAFRCLYETYGRFTNTFASLLSNHINEEVTVSKIRKYNSSIEGSLFLDEVPITVYDNLISCVNNNLDVLYKYYETKKKVLGINELHLYDVYVSMVDEYEKEYLFDDAVDIVRNALSVLGDDYINIYNSGIKNRWIDVYPTCNKRTGGYSSGCYDTYPYILLNYQNRYNDMSTLAHEIGHSIHSYYTRSNNSYLYGDYSIFVAEVASTVNELLLAKYMIKNSSCKEEKLYIINKLLELFRATIYRQTMFAEFEKDIYSCASNDEVLTADLFNNKYYELNKKYFGENVIVDEEIKYEWERIPHFYYNFYVYKYATGLSCACMIVDNILSGKKDAVSNYIKFLKCGRTKNPIDSLMVSCVDVTKSDVVLSAIKMFNDLIEEFSVLYFE